MEETIKYYKFLPDMAPSKLSLNDYIICDAEADEEAQAYDGRRGKDIYSFGVLMREAEKVFPEYDSRENGDVLGFLNAKAAEGTDALEKIRGIIDPVAKGFAVMFRALRRGSQKSRLANELTEADWKFWSSCSHVFIVGRLAEGSLGQCLEQGIDRYMSRWKECGMSIRCFSNPQVKTLSLLGCARADAACGNPVYVFDFGNTAIKSGRAIMDSGHYVIDERPVIVHRNPRVEDNTIETAKQIHQEIISSIKNTIEYYGEEQPGYHVSLCMANNIIRDEIMDRGRYRGLRLLADSYSNYLKHDLEQIMGKEVVIHMMNDAQAAANLFQEWSPNAAVVTLGTRMGIAYP